VEKSPQWKTSGVVCAAGRIRNLVKGAIMSYNITKWTTKSIDNLYIPLSALYDLSSTLIHRGWQPGQPSLNWRTGLCTIDCGEDAYVKGYLQDTNHDNSPDTIQVTEIKFRGEGSGTFFNDVAVPALEKSRGQLSAVVIWEGGDSITSFNVSDGIVTKSRVEL
jgi:hypothetical protein